MAKNDAALIQAGDVLVALALLTRLPLPSAPLARGAHAAWAWPLVGLCVGGAAAAIGWLSIAAGLAPSIAAGFALGATIVVTGALHEDGLADVADGFWGGFDPARRLKIMRDSRIGSFGVIALLLSLGLRWIALTALVGAGAFGVIIAAAVLSRAPMALAMRALPAVRADGLSRHVGQPRWRTGGLGAALAVAVAILLAGGGAIVAALVALCVTLGACAVAQSKIGGQTGDVLGAVQQLSEIAILAVLAGP